MIGIITTELMIINQLMVINIIDYKSMICGHNLVSSIITIQSNGRRERSVVDAAEEPKALP